MLEIDIAQNTSRRLFNMRNLSRLVPLRECGNEETATRISSSDSMKDIHVLVRCQICV